MLSRSRRVLNSAIILSLVAGSSIALPSPSPARAAISSCSASITPHIVAPGSTTNFQLNVTNNDPLNNIEYVLILRPSADFTILSASNPSWDATVSPDQVVMQWGNITSPDTETFTVQAQAANVEAGAASWSVFVSDDPNGSGSKFCSSDTAVEITNGEPFQVSGVSASSLATTSAVITWTTNRPGTSRVDYGQTTAYGATVSDEDSYKTNHSLTLNGLTPGTAYHYKVTSESEGGTVVSSGDNTLVTVSSAPASATGGTGSDPAAPKITPTETSPPVVSISTKLDAPFATAPAIAGQASDNKAVALVEYSLDGGKNWLPAGKYAAAAKVSFQFTPIIPEDGNYQLVVRATDTSGNQTVTKPITLVIDQLPPQVGGALIAAGANIIVPDAETGVINTLAGADQNITMSAIGGPTSVLLRARSRSGGAKDQTFSLTKSPDTGLWWSGLLSFQQAGAFTLTVESIDGAGNQAKRQLAIVNVNPAPQILQKGSDKPVSAAKVSVYSLSPETNTWSLWDGAAYDQPNPQVTSSDGTYRLILPSGKFYMRVEASGFRTVYSQIFELQKPTPISSSLSLRSQGWNIGSIHIALPQFLPDRVTIQTENSKLAAKPNGITPGQTPATFSLQTLTGQSIRSIDLNGRPTVVTMLATWHPATSEQLQSLANLQENKNLNIIPVASQERAGKARVFLGRAGLSLNMAADPDGVLINRFGTSSLPTHYFLDRTGVVRKVEVGVLTEPQIIGKLQSL